MKVLLQFMYTFDGLFLAVALDHFNWESFLFSLQIPLDHHVTMTSTVAITTS